MQVARACLGAASVNGKIYAIGGHTQSGGGGTIKGPLPVTGGITGVSEEYDPAADTWRFKASMPTPDDFAIAAYRGEDLLYRWICGERQCYLGERGLCS